MENEDRRVFTFLGSGGGGGGGNNNDFLRGGPHTKPMMIKEVDFFSNSTSERSARNNNKKQHDHDDETAAVKDIGSSTHQVSDPAGVNVRFWIFYQKTVLIPYMFFVFLLNLLWVSYKKLSCFVAIYIGVSW